MLDLKSCYQSSERYEFIIDFFCFERTNLYEFINDRWVIMFAFF